MHSFVGGLTILPCPDTLDQHSADENAGQPNSDPSVMMRSLEHIWHDFWFDPVSRWLAVSAAVINFGHWALVLATVPRGDQFVPLHYTIYFGIDLSAHWTRGFVMPAVGTAILILHLLTSGIVRDMAWRRSWFLIALSLNAILFSTGVALWRIIQTTV